MPESPTDNPNPAKASFSAQLVSFSYIYWLANWMEVVERFAYYGVRVVLPVFMVATYENGGPQFDQIQKGEILAVWAIVQSFVPILSGGFADRFGYKLNIALSTVLKIIGYLVMGYTIFMTEYICGGPLTETGEAGKTWVFLIFFCGAMFLAFGTAIFKPGVQGLIVRQMPNGTESLGWGIFYQMVNVGGFLGPLLTGYLCEIRWDYVFLACAVAICLNFIPLFMFKEPDRPRDIASNPIVMLYKAIRGLLEPRLFFFTLSFAGFWLMFTQLFDILPNFIEDWVDSRGVVHALTGILPKDYVPTNADGNLTQAWMLNFNALLISLFAFSVGYLTGKVRSLSAIVIGIGISAVAIYALGLSMNGWWILAAIGLFSLGEMMASPTKMRYLAGIAPPGKEGQYMGYANFTVGIGWSIGSIVAGHLYEEGGDKVVLARRYLVEHQGMTRQAVDDITKNDLLPFFEKTLGIDAWQTRQLLWDTYEPYSMWLIFTLIGLASMVAIMIYNIVVTAANVNPQHSFNTRGGVWVRAFLIPICLLFAVALYFAPRSIGLWLNTAFFYTMLLISFVGKDDNHE